VLEWDANNVAMDRAHGWLTPKNLHWQNSSSDNFFVTTSLMDYKLKAAVVGIQMTVLVALDVGPAPLWLIECLVLTRLALA